MALSIYQFVILFGWFPLVALIVFMLLIARFYERFSGKRTYFHLLVISIVLFGIAFVRYASIDRITGDALADISMGLGGLALLIVSVRLYWLMIIQR